MVFTGQPCVYRFDIALYYNGVYELESKTLETKEFFDSHTGINIAGELQSILSEWNLDPTMLSGITTDNGSNIVLATSILNWPRIACFSHTLQLAVEAATDLQQLSRALGCCRCLVGHFNHSYNSCYILKKKQVDLQHKTLSLIQDVQTRWNSTYFMAERIINQQQPLCAALLELKKGELMPTDAEFSALESYCKVMKPLVDITEAIGAEKWVTVSTVSPLLYKLLNCYFTSSPDDSVLEKAMKKAMKQNLSGRYEGSALLTLNVAAFLDPRFRSLSYLPEEDRKTVINTVEKEVALIMSSAESTSATSSSEPSLEPPAKKQRGEKMLFSLMSDIIQPTTTSDVPAERTKVEVQRYAGEAQENERPLVWWRANNARYPTVAIVATKYLSIPATSVPSKRVFSSAGQIVNSKQSCLLPENVNMLVFLAENLK